MAKALPPRPALDWYKKAAKKRLLDLRAADPAARLADAQLAVAREHGFSSWRRLNARVEQLVVDLPALFTAIRDDDRGSIRRLLDEKPELSQVADADGATALHHAAETDNPDAIDLLLARKAEAAVTFGRSAHTALSWALTTEAFESAAALVKNGVVPDLFCAAGLDDVPRIRACFDEGGKLRPDASHTGSSRFAPDGSRLPTPPTEPRQVIADALYMACRLGRAGAVRELLRHDPELSFRAYQAATPLHWAYFGANREVIDMLLAAGADPSLRDPEYGCTPRAFGICVAASCGYPGIFARVLQNDPGAVNLHDGRGTPLHEATRAGQADFVKALLLVGADRTVRDGEGKTPLDLAEAGQHPEVVALLRA